MFNLLFGAYGFPVGLSLCVINGASLFTSNIAYMVAAFIEKKATVWQAMWVVWLSYFTNLCGESEPPGSSSVGVVAQTLQCQCVLCTMRCCCRSGQP